MKICFYANHKKWGHLNNNGGTRTILKSAQILRNLGHSVGVVATHDGFTYFDHTPPIPQVPKKVDVCIAVSILDTIPMLKDCPENVRKYVWIRGWEKWRTSSENLKIVLYKFRQAGGNFLVNSEWLYNKLHNLCIESKILYQGYDDEFTPAQADSCGKKVIGTLYHKSKHKGYKFWLKVKKELGGEYDYLEVGKNKTNDKETIAIYKKCDIWFSAVSLEGLHNCAMEAGLCGCALVHNDSPRNGIWDYGGYNCAGVYKKSNVKDAVEKIRNVDYKKTKLLMQKIKTKIRTRTENMEGFVKGLEETLGRHDG